jgi:uncharacterized protein YndB with AHSA1/START domain
MDGLGTFERHGERVALRFERVFPRPIESVWAAITIAERLADWMSPAYVEPRLGGRFELFIDRPGDARMRGRIVTWEPPHVLESTWAEHGHSNSRIRFELTAQAPDRTRLVFTHVDLDAPWMGLVLPGWHLMFDKLGATLASGKPQARDNARWRALQTTYIDRYGLKDVMTEPPVVA